MALCDQLEQQQTDSIEAHQTLVDTLLGTLTTAESPQGQTEAWARVADHFDTLFTTEHSIKELKQMILRLAVMGKLVAQSSADTFTSPHADDSLRSLALGRRARHPSMSPAG